MIVQAILGWVARSHGGESALGVPDSSAALLFVTGVPRVPGSQVRRQLMSIISVVERLLLASSSELVLLSCDHPMRRAIEGDLLSSDSQAE